MDERKQAGRNQSLVVLEKKIRSLLAQRNSKEEAFKKVNPEDQRIQDEYSERLRIAKGKLITRRILKSKECYSKLITKKNMPKLDFSLLSPSRHIAKDLSVEEIKDNPFKHSPQRSVSMMSRPSAAFEDLSYSGWQQQSPCFGKRPDGSQIEYEDVDGISMRAFRPLDNLGMPSKGRRVSVEVDHRRPKHRPPSAVKSIRHAN